MIQYGPIAGNDREALAYLPDIDCGKDIVNRRRDHRYRPKGQRAQAEAVQVDPETVAFFTNSCLKTIDTFIFD